ncbi:UNVERIFIED_CONTAM: hypothetical protein RMT77_010521 [Armadillidium vulgare]
MLLRSILILFLLVRFSTQEINTFEIDLFLRDYIDKFSVKAIQIFIPQENAESVHQFRIPALLDLKTAFNIAWLNSTSEIIVGEEFQDFVLGMANMKISADYKMLRKISEEKHFRTNRWIIFGDPKTLEPTLSFPYFPLDNQVMFAVTSNNNENNYTSLELFETYQSSIYGNYHVLKIGKWTEEEGIDLMEGDPAERRTNLSDLHLRCVTLEVNHPTTKTVFNCVKVSSCINNEIDQRLIILLVSFSLDFQFNLG